MIPDPDARIARLEVVEDLSEGVADRLLDLADKLRRREFELAREWFTPNFRGHALAELTVKEEKALPLSITRTSYRADDARSVDRAEFLAALERVMGPWSRVESVLWKVKGAEFQAGGDERWGKARLYLETLGVRADGSPISITGWANARVVMLEGRWCVDRFALESLDQDVRAAGPLFTDVATSTGVALVGTRFGKPGNTSFAWNGAASGDFDGDGRFDLFACAPNRNYLYRALGDGTYAEEAEARGVAAPGGGTGAVFFDFDNDGDQDLVVGHVGWRLPDGKLGGNTIQLYVNVGEGKFRAAGAEFGFTEPFVAYTLTAFDYDRDGFVDLFACGYGRVEAEHNNSWIEATNGAPNALFRNLGGKSFRDVAAQAGVRSNRWAYASAAADFDRDGDLDLFVANDYGSKELFRNNGDGTFTDVAASVGAIDRGNGMGIAWGDLDQDGRLDVYAANMSSTAGNRILKRLQGAIEPARYAELLKLAAGNTILLATGDGKFRALPSASGGISAAWAWSPALADFDLDGTLDIFCANGFVTGDLAHDT